jgi:hypothetical protein
MRERMPDRGVATDPFSDLDARRGSCPLEHLLDATVNEPQSCLHPQDGLSYDGEPEVPGFDDARMDRSDGDLVHAVTFDLEERERADVLEEARVGIGLAKHGVPADRPVAMAHQSSAERMPNGPDAVEVAHLPFESAHRVVEQCQARDLALLLRNRQDEFETTIVGPSKENVDDAEVLVVLMADDHAQVKAVLQVGLEDS